MYRDKGLGPTALTPPSLPGAFACAVKAILDEPSAVAMGAGKGHWLKLNRPLKCNQWQTTWTAKSTPLAPLA